MVQGMPVEHQTQTLRYKGHEGVDVCAAATASRDLTRFNNGNLLRTHEWGAFDIAQQTSGP
jgi:hypothetical protein